MKPALMTTVVVVGSATAMLLTGCASNAPASGSSASASASTSAADIGTLTPGVLTVAEDLNYPPEIYKNKDGSIGGFDYDIMTAIGKTLGIKVKFVEVKFEQAIIGLKGAQYDTYPGLYLTKDRLDAIDMVPYFETGNSIVAKNGGADPATAADLCGLKVGVITGAGTIASLKSQSSACVKEGKSAITVQAFPTDPDVSQAVLSGNVDVQLTLSSAATEAVGKSSALTVTSTSLIYPSVVTMGITKGKTKLDQSLTKAVQELSANGELAAIYKKYDLSSVVASDVATAKTN